MSTFEFEGEEYLLNPTMMEFFEQAGLEEAQAARVMKSFEKAGITRLFHLQTMTQNEMEKLLNNNLKLVNKLFTHLQLIKHRGRIIKTGEELELIEKQFEYLMTPTTSLDMMFTYSNKANGLRTGSVIEIFGPAGIGKTQWCFTQAIYAIREWDCSVGIIDSEGAFEYSRISSLGKYYGIDVQNKIFASRANNFDEVEYTLDKFEEIIKKENIRLLIVDSIIDPLKTQYPLSEDLSMLQPRQRHLKQVVDKMKTLAKMYNLIVVYTNQVRADLSTGKMIPQGGNVLSHASDIRVSLTSVKQSEELDKLGLKKCEATIVDCGFLPNLSGEFIVSPMGISDIDNIKEIIRHTEIINKSGIIINQDGDPIE